MNKISNFFSKASRSLSSRWKTFRIKRRANFKLYRQQVVNLGNPRAVIWIFGCQRSGTTFLENTFRHDLDSVVFGEFSQLTIDPDKTVLSNLGVVHNLVESQNAKYAVIRPLFESDRAIELLNLFPNSVGIWMFRDCPHVVDSMIRKWGEKFFERSKQVETDQNGVWRLEEINNLIRAKAQAVPSNEPLAEMYARYWLSRNTIPFHADLQNDVRMLFMSYRQLVSNPRSYMEKIMRQAGRTGLWTDFKLDVHTSSLERPVNRMITDETLAQCDQVYQQLNELSQGN